MCSRSSNPRPRSASPPAPRLVPPRSADAACPSFQLPSFKLPFSKLPLFIATLAILASPAVVRAQTLVWLDAGGARVQQPTSALKSAGSVGGGVWHGRGAVAIAAEGNVTMASDSVNAAQYVARATFLPRPWSRTDIDVSATTNGFALPGINGSNGSEALSARQHIMWRSIELGALAGAGRTSRVDLRAKGHRFGASLAWQRSTRLGMLRAGTQFTRNWTDDYKLMEASGITLREVAPAYTLADRQVDVAWQRGALWLQTARSWRAGTGATLGKASGFHVAAAWTMNASTTLVAQVGEQLADVVRGVPQARYTGVSMRWNPIRPRSLRRDARALGDERGGTLTVNTVPEVRGEEVVVQRRTGSGDLVVTIVASDDAVVEIATSANEWMPVRMTRDGTVFVHRLTLPSGSHRVAVRVNGGEWRAPRGLVAVQDDFGGQAGLVVVP